MYWRDLKIYLANILTHLLIGLFSCMLGLMNNTCLKIQELSADNIDFFFFFYFKSNITKNSDSYWKEIIQIMHNLKVRNMRVYIFSLHGTSSKLEHTFVAAKDILAQDLQNLSSLLNIFDKTYIFVSDGQCKTFEYQLTSGCQIRNRTLKYS